MAQQQWAGGKVLSEVEDGIGLITFNQPEKRNAMSVDMWGGLEQILTSWENDDAVRVVVMTGAGDKAFVSGADISQFESQRGNADAQRTYDRLTRAGAGKLASFPKVIIARIRGFCLGGGLAIAMQADLRIASENSEFGIPAAKLGIAYGFGGVHALVSLVGPANARMILYTGKRFDAAEALRMGLVNEVVTVEDLVATVDEIARTVARNAPLSVRASKLTVAQVLRDPAERDLEGIRTASEACFNSDDYKEGRRAFMEKRSPKFTGK